MKVAITGASGTIGKELTATLQADGHTVFPVRRAAANNSSVPAERTSLQWDPAAGVIEAGEFEGMDAVVHLAGQPIGEKRWTTEVKLAIEESRVAGTRLLATHLASLAEPPKVFISGSAIGFYGDRPGSSVDGRRTAAPVLDESSPGGTGFLPEVVQAWEAAARPAQDAGIRTVCARTGIVIDPDSGAFQKMLLPFRLGLGGIAGSGDQYMSWISLQDEVAALAFCIDHDSVSGPVNLTAPNPVTNREFSKTLAKILHRPCTRIPMLGPRLLYGRELADTLLLEGQRVEPVALLAAGFHFSDPVLEVALRRMLNR